jgi:hypothetical protein
VIVAVPVAGCATGPDQTTSAGPSPSRLVSADVGSPSPADPGTPSGSGRPASPSAVDATVPWDASLLAVLPADVEGLPLTPEADAFEASASDPDLVRDATAGAVAFVVDPATTEYAVAFVYRLRQGTFDEAWYRSWRDTFDEGVCAQAGGVTGNAEAEIGGRQTHIGSCAGGVRTYHVRLTDGGDDRIVSVQSLGEAHLGELVIAGLRG